MIRRNTVPSRRVRIASAGDQVLEPFVRRDLAEEQRDFSPSPEAEALPVPRGASGRWTGNVLLMPNGMTLTRSSRTPKPGDELVLHAIGVHEDVVAQAGTGSAATPG